MIIALPNDQSYRLPIPQYVAVDDLILEQLDPTLNRNNDKYLFLIYFGAGVGQYGHVLLAKDLKHRYMGYDGAGDVGKFTHSFLSFFDLTTPFSFTQENMCCV
jgi:hypothetical protein